LVEFLDSVNFFYPFQYGFRRSFNVTDAMFDIVIKLQGALDRDELGAGLFLDLRKAFDSADHVLLMRKIRAASIDGKVFH